MDSQINYNCRGHQRQTALAVDGSRRSPLSLGNLATHNPSPQSWKLESDPTTDLNRASETERMSALRWRSETLSLASFTSCKLSRDKENRSQLVHRLRSTFG